MAMQTDRIAVLHELRSIAFIASSLMCLLLIAFWVRSYWQGYVVHCPTPRPMLVNIVFGKCQICAMPNDIGTGWKAGWGWQSFEPRREFAAKRSWGWNSDQYTTSIDFPAWIVVLILFAATVATWQTPRYSMRAMLVGMTMIATLLGVVTYALRN